MAVDIDIRNALSQVKNANSALAKDDTRPHREEVCIQTRAAYAIFDEVMSWAGVVDDAAKLEMISVFEVSVRLLQNSTDETKDNHCHLKATEQRLKKLQKYEPIGAALTR